MSKTPNALEQYHLLATILHVTGYQFLCLVTTQSGNYLLASLDDRLLWNFLQW